MMNAFTSLSNFDIARHYTVSIFISISVSVLVSFYLCLDCGYFSTTFKFLW